MNKKITKYLIDGFAITILSALVLGAVWLSFKQESLPERVKQVNRLKKGKMDFSFYDLSGNKYLFSDFRNSTVLVNVWATWCAPCIEEIPSMVRLVKSFKKDFVLIAVTDESSEVVRQFFKRVGEKVPKNFIVGISNDVYDILKPGALPESFLFNADGKLYQKIIGPRVWDSHEWKTNIRNLIEKGEF